MTPAKYLAVLLLLSAGTAQASWWSENWKPVLGCTALSALTYQQTKRSVETHKKKLRRAKSAADHLAANEDADILKLRERYSGFQLDYKEYERIQQTITAREKIEIRRDELRDEKDWRDVAVISAPTSCFSFTLRR